VRRKEAWTKFYSNINTAAPEFPELGQKTLGTGLTAPFAESRYAPFNLPL
jgi:hypothetical protein